MTPQEMKQIAVKYASRGPMTLEEFLEKHQISERKLRRAIKESSVERQVPLPFAPQAPMTLERRVELLEEQNERLRRSLDAALVALKTMRAKSDAAIQAVLGSFV